LPRLVSMRTLRKREILIARKLRIRRYYLPSLNKAESAEFFKEFDKFWDQVVKPFGHDHVFWRNVVSSKMQEWERSAAYLALVLFTLAKKSKTRSQLLIIVCSSLEEEDICEAWGRKRGWKVYRRPFLSLPLRIRRIFQEAHNLKDFLFMCTVSLYRKFFSPRYAPKQLQIDRLILIASRLYQSSFNNGNYADPFFGNLHDILRKNGNFVTYLCNPLGSLRESAKKIKECTEVAVVVPYSIITWAELISLLLELFIRRVRVPHSYFFGCDFSRLLRWNSRYEHFFNLDAEIYYRAVRKLCRSKHFERLIQLYEGNVFERGCIQAFREHSPRAILGYSHAVVFPLNLKIRLTDNEKRQRPEPDILLSTGPETKRLMIDIGKRDTSRVYSACSLRNIPLLDDTDRFGGVQSEILVALGGVLGCATALCWLMEQAEILKDYNVKLRGHPNVPVNTLLDQCLHDMPYNFHLSDSDLETELRNSVCVVYRQSSVGMQALLNGVPAIHLNIDAPLSGDPMMDLKTFKWTVCTPEQLGIALKEILTLDEKRKRKYIRVAKKYVKDYFAVPDENNVLSFLGNIAQ